MRYTEQGGGTIATLHLICGLPCAGKTTFARRLEQEQSALRLTPDEWHTRLFGLDLEEEEHNARHDLIESMLCEIGYRVLALGVNVILDFGFWGRSEREDHRLRAARLGADTKIHFLDVSEEVLLARLAARNAQLPPDTFPIPEDQLKGWIALFQPPTQEELEYREALE
jgi:predicted kinase